MKNKQYYFEDDKPEMKQSVVLVADIIGYNSMIEEAYKNNNEQENLSELHIKIKEALKSVDNPNKSKWVLKTFSDNILVGCPYLATSEGGWEFSQVCSQACQFQLNLALDGIFIRGGIGVGNIHVGDEIVFGYVLHEVKEAEKKAKYPRIIL